MVMSGISATPRVAQGVRRGIRPASEPASRGRRRFPTKRDLACAEPFRLAWPGAHNERALVVDTRGGACYGLGALGDGHRLAPKNVEALPEGGELVAVVVLDETTVGGEDAGNECGGETVDVDRGAAGLGERDGRALELAREVVGGRVEIEAEAEDEVVNLIGVDARLGEHAAGLAALEQQVVGPFEAGLDAAEIGDEFADAEAHPEREILQTRRLEFRPEDKGAVEIAGRRAVPGAPTPAPALGLFAGQDHQGGGCAGGEVTGGFGVRAVDLVERDKVR